jgi:hypothetical protein
MVGSAKRELKKDGHFQVPNKKTEPIIYQAKEVSLQNRLMGSFAPPRASKPAAPSPRNPQEPSDLERQAPAWPKRSFPP